MISKKERERGGNAKERYIKRIEIKKGNSRERWGKKIEREREL